MVSDFLTLQPYIQSDYRATNFIPSAVAAVAVEQIRRPAISSDQPMLARLRWGGLMIVADLFDLAVRDLHYFRPQRFNDFAELRTRAAKERFGNSATAIARAQAQIAVAVGKLIEAGLVMAADHIATFPTLAGWIDDHGMLVKARHHGLDIVLVERVKIALDEFFFPGVFHCLTSA